MLFKYHLTSLKEVGEDVTKTFTIFNIALGSSFELETQVIISKEFDYIDQETADDTCKLINNIQKMI